MTASEMSYEFKILYDKITNFDAPGYEPEEISRLLTKAQERVVFDCYNPLGNKYKQGFEDTEARRRDLRALVIGTTLSTPSTDQPNIQGSDVTEASISYKLGDGDYTVVDITANIPDTVVGEFIAAEIEMEGYEDGYMTILYTLTTASTTYTKTYLKIFTCSSRCCVDNMWADIADSACGNCECDLEEKISNALMAEGFLRAIKSAGSCATSTGVNAMIAKIEKLCDWEDCNCN